MQAAWLNRAQVWATTGRPATSRKSLSTFGPMRVPLPAATMMALFTGLQSAGSGLPTQARPHRRGERLLVVQTALHAGRQSNNFNCTDCEPLYSLICGAKARSKVPVGNASL